MVFSCCVINLLVIVGSAQALDKPLGDEYQPRNQPDCCQYARNDQVNRVEGGDVYMVALAFAYSEHSPGDGLEGLKEIQFATRQFSNVVVHRRCCLLRVVWSIRVTQGPPRTNVQTMMTMTMMTSAMASLRFLRRCSGVMEAIFTPYVMSVYLTSGGVSNVWNGAGDGTVHSSASAPSQGL